MSKNKGKGLALLDRKTYSKVTMCYWCKNLHIHEWNKYIVPKQTYIKTSDLQQLWHCREKTIKKISNATTGYQAEKQNGTRLIHHIQKCISDVL